MKRKRKKNVKKTRYTCMHIARHSSTKDLFFLQRSEKQCLYENGSRNQEIERS